MAFNLGALAQFGFGYGRGRAAAEEKKQRSRQQILALTGRALQQKQASEDRAQAEKDRQTNAAGVLDYRQRHDSELMQVRKDAAGATAENRRQNTENAAQNRKIKTLQDYITGAGTGRFANLSSPQQASAVQGMNEAGGTSFPVPGAPTGEVRPRNYGLPPQTAQGVNNAVTAFGGEVPTVPMTVPYFQPTPDQLAVRAQKGAATAHVEQATREAPQRFTETKRHNQASENMAGAGLHERMRHAQVGEAQGAQRIDEGMQRLLQGDQRVQQGDQRLSIMGGGGGGGGKGAPTYRDFQTIVEKNNTEKNKILAGLQVWNKEKNRFDPLAANPQEQSILSQADYNIHQAQHGQRAQARGVSPVTGQGTAPMNPFGAGMQVIRMRGGGSARIPYAPPLPGFNPAPSNQPPQNAALVHHSHAQPRRTTGAKAGQFKKGKVDLSKMTDAQLFDMIKR